jgi:hypothetical protein
MHEVRMVVIRSGLYIECIRIPQLKRSHAVSPSMTITTPVPVRNRTQAAEADILDEVDAD